MRPETPLEPYRDSIIFITIPLHLLMARKKIYLMKGGDP